MCISLVQCAGLALLTLSCFLTATAEAEVRLPRIFANQMVLQRDMPIHVWGWAAPGEAVTVELSRKGEGAPVSGKATADKDGRWSVELPAQTAASTVGLTIRGKNVIELQDVLIGDVWVCSGQSNMGLPVGSLPDAAAIAAQADHPQIRFLTVEKAADDEPREDVNGQWHACSPATVRNMSAAAYFFSREVQGRLKVPVGLIVSAWGDTSAEAWTPVASVATDAELKAAVEKRLADTANVYKKFRETRDKTVADWQKARDAALAAGEAPPPFPALGYNSEVRRRPGTLFNGMIAPLVPLAVKGVIWYQGEANTNRAAQYGKLFTALITEWRRQFKQPELPFLFVQLPNYVESPKAAAAEEWQRLREAQTKALTLPKTAMACAIDVGDATNLHPPDKLSVGRRLALGALHVAYGQNLIYSGPVFKKMEVAGHQATLAFDHVGGGLMVKGGAALKGFVVAGADRKLHGATGKIVGDQVVITSEAADKIVAVRYAWADNPECNLYNQEGLPAVPFRTDDW